MNTLKRIGMGVLFMMVGRAILSSRSQTMTCLTNYLERRYPQYHKHVADLREKMMRYFMRH